MRRASTSILRYLSGLEKCNTGAQGTARRPEQPEHRGGRRQDPHSAEAELGAMSSGGRWGLGWGFALYWVPAGELLEALGSRGIDVLTGLLW